jgi:hypothetical protein
MNKKIIILVVALITFLVIGFIVFRHINPSVGFRYYEPSYLPPNVSIREKRIDISESNVSVDQNFRTEDWVYSIIEDKDDGSSSIGTANQDYDAKSVGPTCNIQNSPEKMKYRVCHWIDYGRINVHEVIFIKNGTYIYSAIPTTTDQEISPQETGKYVDSFTPKSTIGLPVLRSTGP